MESLTLFKNTGCANRCSNANGFYGFGECHMDTQDYVTLECCDPGKDEKGDILFCRTCVASNEHCPFCYDTKHWGDNFDDDNYPPEHLHSKEGEKESQFWEKSSARWRNR